MRGFVLLALVALSGCGGSELAKDDPLPAETARVFAFDRGAPLDVTEGEQVVQRPIAVTGMSYASPGGDRVSGIVVRPLDETEGRPGVLFVHGSGGSRVDFLDEAILLAKQGAVALTIDSAFARSERPDVQAGMEPIATTRALMIQTTEDVLRGLDVLVERYGVDPGRLALVGYSMGVQPATLAASLEPRLKALVVMAGRAYPSGRTSDPEAARAFGPLDTVHYVGHVAPASILFQGGKADTVIGRAEMNDLYAAASEPKEMRWYAGGHGLLSTKDERLSWLGRRLGLE